MGEKGLQVIDVIGLCETFGHQSHFIFPWSPIWLVFGSEHPFAAHCGFSSL